MPDSPSASQTSSFSSFDEGLSLRRIRHITSIQVRNLTPFPVRDAFTSALAQPSEQPQFNAHGHLSDDLDVTMAKKRGRRKSSIPSLKALASDGDTSQRDIAHGSEHGVRNRALSKASTLTTSSTSHTSSKPHPSNGHPVVRPHHRKRTSSTASSTGSQLTHGNLFPDGNTSATSFSGFLRDTSQVGLENVLHSRLIETFITITISDQSFHYATAPSIALPYSSTPATSSPSHPPTKPAPARRSTIVASGRNTVPIRAPSSKQGVSSATSPASLSRVGPPSMHAKSMSVSIIPNGKVPRPSAPKTFQRAPIPSHLTFPNKDSLQLCLEPPPDHFPDTSIPDYLSAIHRPSTNPCFTIDAKGGIDFVPQADLSGHMMKVEIWGKVFTPLTAKGKGKQKEATPTHVNHTEEPEWEKLETWDVNLNNLIPLQDPTTSSLRLPSNTLVITLSPPNQAYFLPSSRSSRIEVSPERSPSPTTGYNSDPESNVDRVREVRKPVVSAPVGLGLGNVDHSHDIGVEDLDAGPRSSKRKGTLKTASWQDLLKLVTLQNVLHDTQESLSDVMHKIDSLLMDNDTGILTREVLERKTWLTQLQDEQSTVINRVHNLRDRLSTQRIDIEARKQILGQAQAAYSQDLQASKNLEAHVEDGRKKLAELRSHLPSIRSELFTTLAFIFPIELVSPPDLLFTILDVPLPIPTRPTDPAPPLTLLSHKEVTEDAVATALGYAAQVAQLLAAYLGKGLVYPVTCVGSRSLIKDNISAMVGPRMFPLFSRGVDTYRFEYAVFLLNKDIEMLMTDRNLKALDMRHTLPNLKNLLLTLTDPDTVEPRSHRLTNITLTGGSSTPHPSAARPDDASCSQAENANTADTVTFREHLRIEIDSPPASGSTTPTRSIAGASTPTIRKSRAFLDLTPLTSFRWVRYPSSSRSSDRKAEPPIEEDNPLTANGTVENDIQNGDEDDDRRTIRADAPDEDTAGGLLNGINENGTMVASQQAAEKVASKKPDLTQMVEGVS